MYYSITGERGVADIEGRGIDSITGRWDPEDELAVITLTPVDGPVCVIELQVDDLRALLDAVAEAHVQMMADDGSTATQNES